MAVPPMEESTDTSIFNEREREREREGGERERWKIIVVA
jgi:hypothetical protein